MSHEEKVVSGPLNARSLNTANERRRRKLQNSSHIETEKITEMKNNN